MPRLARLLAVAVLLGCAMHPGQADTNSLAAHSTERFIVDQWQTEKGLPGHVVLAVTQTRDGYLWVGTLFGLARFDGFHFEVFDESNTPGLNSGRILHIFEDSRRDLWIGTETAGVVMAKENGEVLHLELGLGGGTGRLVASCEDSAGRVWLHTGDGRLFCSRDGRLELVPLRAPRFSSRRLMIAIDSGRILIGSDQLLGVFQPSSTGTNNLLQTEKLTPLVRLDALLASRRGGYWRIADGEIQKWTEEGGRHIASDAWGQARVSAVCEDRTGALWVGTLGAGLFVIDEQGQVLKLSKESDLSSDFVLALHEDREGAMWVGTDGGGLNRVKRPLFQTVDNSRDRVVQSVCEDPQGGLWVGYNLRTNLDHWSEGKLTEVRTDRAAPDVSVKAVLADRQGRVWAGIWGGGAAWLLQQVQGGFNRVIGAPLYNREVLALHQDRGDRLWVGTRSGLLLWAGQEWREFTSREGLSTNQVRALADDRQGNLWIGTSGGGLNRWHDGTFTQLQKKDGLPSDDVSALYLDDQDVLWVGTDGGGLGRLEHGKWTRYSTHEGLVSNSIGYLVEDAQGNLWIGSNAGLMRVAKQKLNDFARGQFGVLPIRTYGLQDGLPSSECTQGSQPAACRTRSGHLLFPTIRGLAVVDPARLTPNTNAPPVIIESVLLDDLMQSATSLRAPHLGKVIVPAGSESIEIRYTSLNLAAPERARFRYRLEGHETAWVETANNRLVRYSKVPAGHYLFRVTACNEDGVWNDAGSSLAFIIQPPFWQTWWFLTATALAVLGSIVAVVRYFSVQKLARQLAVMRQQEALEKERARIARDIHDQLGASLTQVSLLGELVEADKDQPAEVEAHARQISQTARDTTRTLDEIVWTVNPSNDTLEGLANYICKYAQDYLGVAEIRYRLEVPPNLPAAPIPPEVRHNVFLAAKEAVTNIVRHAHATSAWIRLKLEPAHFTLEIADDGRGLAGMDEQRAATRNGLRNMRRRMEDVGGGFEMGPAPEGGLQIRLTVPVGPRGPTPGP
jgi:ligand-binding sensor domain-containing protein/signal transduction histidine kinase